MLYKRYCQKDWIKKNTCQYHPFAQFVFIYLKHDWENHKDAIDLYNEIITSFVFTWERNSLSNFLQYMYPFLNICLPPKSPTRHWAAVEEDPLGCKSVYDARGWWPNICVWRQPCLRWKEHYWKCRIRKWVDYG